MFLFFYLLNILLISGILKKCKKKGDLIMNDKFDEVVSDILEKIFSMKYEDKEKEIIRTNIMMNLYQMTRDDKIYEKNVQTLKLQNNAQNNR